MMSFYTRINDEHVPFFPDGKTIRLNNLTICANDRKIIFPIEGLYEIYSQLKVNLGTKQRITTVKIKQEYGLSNFLAISSEPNQDLIYPFFPSRGMLGRQSKKKVYSKNRTFTFRIDEKGFLK